MPNQIVILGRNAQRCTELQNILQGQVADQILTATEKDLSRIDKSAEEQRRRAELLGELIRLFSSSLRIDKLLIRAVSKSTELLGDVAFIVLSNGTKGLRLQAAHSKNRSRLRKILITVGSLENESITRRLVAEVLILRQSVVIEQLQQAEMSREAKALVEEHALASLLAVPIHGKDMVLGAFVSLTTGARKFTANDRSIATALADFTAVALEKAGALAELHRSTVTDWLTGAYNIRFFHEVLARETARANRYATPVSLLLIDIDSFKLVNDTFGHPVGDKVLVRLSSTLQELVRNSDFVFRYGGDEFAVVLPGTNVEGAMYVAEKILQGVNKAGIFTVPGYSKSVTVSIGVSEYIRQTPFETLVSQADQALYACKASSKNCAKEYRANSEAERAG
jgi:diguanylate cyclase (GGDEF)-like protein